MALVNANLAGDALARAIAMVAPKHVIAGSGLAGALAAVVPQLPAGLKCWSHGHSGAEISAVR